MKIKDIKKTNKPLKEKEVWKERDVASGSGMLSTDKKEKEPAFMSEKWRTKKLHERTERIQAKQERIEAKRELQSIKDARKFEKQERNLILLEHKRQQKLKKLQVQTLKTQNAEFKRREREAKYGRLREAVSKSLERGDVKSRATIETAQYKRQQVARDREKMRAEMEAEREYQRKFGVQQEGQGELPYYEKEHGKPLPEKKEVSPKKKTFTEELF